MALGTARQEIPALAHITHLNTGGMAPLPRAVGDERDQTNAGLRCHQCVGRGNRAAGVGATDARDRGPVDLLREDELLDREPKCRRGRRAAPGDGPGIIAHVHREIARRARGDDRIDAGPAQQRELQDA